MEENRMKRIDAVKALTDRYELLETEEIAELASTGLLLRHKKSGARVAVLLNEDENKVFSIAFRTTPTDSTGVAHIVEHTVLCGSKNFPAKDSFVELAKGSLNTFLNALTSPDRTLYPVASCNQKDFQNLMHVYLDAVFFPNIYQNRQIFEQEGWRLEVAQDGTLSYNGVVYNEMKGALSSPDDLLFGQIGQSLFPDNTYQYEFGGDPAVIPQLSYEQFLEFHKRYYHPSNSYIYLYGDMDAAERLDWMDREYLSHFEYLQVDSAIPIQTPVKKEQITAYSVGAGEEKGEELAWNVVIGNCSDTLLKSACEILEYVLVEVPGAPVKKALSEAGIGRDVYGMVNTAMRQPVLCFIAKDAPPKSKEMFLQVLMDTLKQQAEQGIDKKSLLAAINYLDFRYREADFGYPKGLVYNMTMLSEWLYEEEKPFQVLKQAEIYDKLRKLVENGYFEQLLREKILDNPHCSVVVLQPEAGRTERLEEEEKKRLAHMREAMSQEELKQVRQEQERLRAFQERPATEEELQAIPLLALSDIEKRTQPLICEEKSLSDRPLLRHEVRTNGIVYLRLLFDVSDIPEEDIPYLGLLTKALGYVDTEHYSYGEYASEMLLHTGGIRASLGIYTKKNQADEYQAYLEVHARYLEGETGAAFGLIEEMLCSTIYDREKRMHMILAETVSRIQQRLADNGHETVINRGMSYVSASGKWRELSRGIAYYRFLKGLLEHFEEKKEEMAEKLAGLAERIFTTTRLTMSITAWEEGFRQTEEELDGLMKKLGQKSTGKDICQHVRLLPERKNEAFTYAGSVQFVGRMGNFAKAGFCYTGALRVLKMILGFDYLWNQIRVKGGAYGCFGGFAMDGDSYMVSYRDPNLEETQQVYEGVTEYVRQFQADEREMTKYIIGTFSTLDAPLSPSAKGARALSAWIRGITEEDYQREREEALQTTPESIRALEPLLAEMLADNCRCCIGNESKIEKNRELYEHIERL